MRLTGGAWPHLAEEEAGKGHLAPGEGGGARAAPAVAPRGVKVPLGGNSGLAKKYVTFFSVK